MKQPQTEDEELPYSYKMLDGLMLLRALRQEHLRYPNSFPAPENDSLAATRQNREGIFLADPYSYASFAESLRHDIAVITDTTTQWTAMPSMLILPLLSGREWRGIHVSLDYAIPRATVTWIDPYGEAYFPVALKSQLTPALGEAVLHLVRTQSGQPHAALENLIHENTIEQQEVSGPREYDYDSGSFVFGKITRTISKHLVLNPPIIGDYNYHNAMEQLRRTHRRMCSDISGLEGEAIPVSVLQQAERFNTAPLDTSHETPPQRKQHPTTTAIQHHGISYREIKRPNTTPISLQATMRSSASTDNSEEVDYFAQHVKHHFRSIVDQLERLDRQTIERYLHTFQKEVERLGEEGMFADTEAVIRSLVLKKAQDTVIHKMATLLAMTLEQDGQAYYSLIPIQDVHYKQNLVRYYGGQSYRFFQQEKEALESYVNDTPHLLAKRIDTELLNEVADPLWQAHIRYTHLSDIMELFSEYGRYRFSENMPIANLREHSETLKSYLDEETYIHDVIVASDLKEILTDFLKHEEDFITHIVQDQENGTFSPYWQAFQDSALPALHETIAKSLRKETRQCSALFSDYEEQIANYRLQLYPQALSAQESTAFTHGNLHIFYKKTASSPSLSTHSGYATFAPYRGYDSSKQVNTESFYHYFLPQEHQPGASLRYYPDSRTGLSNPHFLLTVYGQKDYLAQEAHQIGEYDQELIEDVLRAIDFEGIGINPYVVNHIIHRGFLDRDYLPEEIVEDNFAPKITGRFVKEVREQQPITDKEGNFKQQAHCLNRMLTSMRTAPEGLEARVFALVNAQLGTAFTPDNLRYQYKPLEDAILQQYAEGDNQVNSLLEEIYRQLGDEKAVTYMRESYAQQQEEMLETRKVFSLPSIEEYIATIQAEFAQSLQDTRIQGLRRAFNDAYRRKDWLQVQQLWPVFTKFQRLLVSATDIEPQHPKDRSFKYGDRDFPAFKKHGKENREVAAPANKEDLLEKAWNHYNKHASEYTRIYVTDDTHSLSYSSKNHPATKTATLDFNPVLCELTEVGQLIHSTLKEHQMPDRSVPNILAPTLYFVVTDRPHEKGGEHRRIFVPVDLQPLIEGLPLLLSNDSDEGVFTGKTSDEKRAIALSDCKTGYDVMGITPPAGLDNTPYKELNHSERVLIELLRNPNYVKRLIPLLQESLETILEHPLEAGKYKVYAVALLSYSTNSVCNHCTPSLVAQQASHDTGFLYHLANALNNDASPFKTSGYDKEQQRQLPEKLRMLSVITSTSPWTEQAYHLSDQSKVKKGIPDSSKLMANPRGILKLPGNKIDLHQLGSDAAGNAYTSHRSFVEFTGTKFRKYCHPANQHPDLTKTGHVFMSNSKEYIMGADKLSALDEKIEQIMERQQSRKTQAITDWKEYVKNGARGRSTILS